ncbi:MAG: type IV pilus twitching motility protein PilT [Candidatus Omnitrophota bacterium]
MMKTDLDGLLKTLIEKSGSDLHLQANSVPVFRINGDLVFSDAALVTSEDIESFVSSVMDDAQKEAFYKTKHLDFSYSLEGIGRFRINVFRQRGHAGCVARAIPMKVPDIGELGLPSVVKDLALKPNGLVVVTGPTGSGKSTTLAAIIDFINGSRKDHIITIEDPVEFVHANKSCVINQRELGVDTDSFSAALRDALREDPDVILVGEMRDLDTISNAITAAETGHLVFATLHTNSAVQTIDRIIDVFPPHQQGQIRTQLSSTLRGVVSQLLLRRKDGKGRIAAFEIMVGNTPIRSLIKDGKTHQLYSTIQMGRSDGMQTMDWSLMELVKNGIISPEEASSKVMDRTAFDLLKYRT